MFGNSAKVSVDVPSTAADKKHRWVPLEKLRSAGYGEKGRPLKLPGSCSFASGPVVDDKGHTGV